ncbi:MAG: 3,5-nucleoside bisphosphate phosphatase [Pseudonocardiales bacterium]|jgi:predicted metal-dependent phosphoesterase TrpH|nr:3,5-nucleoside bisphosphate phosphatase [Pseudonocardiales bacterium]
MIDLHTHSTTSDGTDTPGELIVNAVKAGIHTLALTDHDTAAGWDAASEAVRALSVPFTLIRGTEFSCVYYTAEGTRIGLHLLGYLYDPTAPELKAERARLRENRLGRGERIVSNLANAGYPIDWQQVTEIAAGGVVGRPHIGQALVASGVVPSVNEAFAELLHNRSPYYVPKEDMAVREAIGLIRRAGGVPVIAHPWARKRGKILSEQALSELGEAGLLGIEVDHPDHVPEDRHRLAQIAGELGLLTTGSSDYHGTNKAVPLGAERTRPEELERLIEQAAGIEPIRSAAR